MLWRAWFQDGFLMEAWFNTKVPFLETLVIYLSYCRIWLILLKHCCENVFFWEPYVGWERSQKVFHKFLSHCCFFVIIEQLFIISPSEDQIWWQVGNLLTLVYRQGKLKKIVNFEILWLTWMQKGLLKLLTISKNERVFFGYKMRQTKRKPFRVRDFLRFFARNCSLHLEHIFFKYKK